MKVKITLIQERQKTKFSTAFFFNILLSGSHFRLKELIYLPPKKEPVVIMVNGKTRAMVHQITLTIPPMWTTSLRFFAKQVQFKLEVN